MAAAADVLVVGAGPTGLALALQLAASGVRARVVDRGADRVHESRALAVQPRTLEVLAPLGATPELVARGNPTVRLRLHTRRRDVAVQLFDLGLADTAHPYLLFLSQAETERILEERLRAAGGSVERGVELTGLRQVDDGVRVTLRRPGLPDEAATARYVVGCDGAHSTVRHLAGIGFGDGAYRQGFVLADLEAEGLEPGTAHAFLTAWGLVFFFPLVHPASWRLIAMRAPAEVTAPDRAPTRDELQALVDAATGGAVRLGPPVWATHFRLHHRAAARYRAGRVFVAGDAAHIHSPAGAQGMNTGIQDAVNLGWKLAQALRRGEAPGLLDSYEAERLPVGRAVLRFTDRAFTVATSAGPIVRLARTRAVPVLLPLALATPFGRGRAFRTVAELAIRYRHGPLSVDGPGAPRRGPRAGDRLPDGHLVRAGRPETLHRIVAGPSWHLLLCSPPGAWAEAPRDTERRGVAVHRLVAHPTGGAADVPGGPLLRRLGLGAHDTAQFLVRPDGHVGYRAGGTDLTGLGRYLDRWLPEGVPGGPH